MLLLALLLLPQDAAPSLDTVTGLLPGERAVELGPNPGAVTARLATTRLATGRLVDGRTRAPIAGARVEVYLEDFHGPLDAPVPGGRLARATTGPDGAWTIELEGVAYAEKVRVEADGHRPCVVSVSHRGELALLPPDDVVVRVLDFAGAPIPGAAIWTEQTCRHDPPAFVGRADAAGRIDLGRRPANDHGGEGRLAAPGFAAVEDLDLDELVLDAARDGEARLYLPRRAPIAYRFTEHPGAERVILFGDPERTATLDEDLGFEFDSPGVERGECMLWLPATAWAAGYRTEIAPYAPRSRKLAIHPRSVTEAPPGPAATIRVRAAGIDAGDLAGVPLVFVHESGYWDYGRTWVEEGCLHVAASAGAGTLVVGGDFSGWCEQVVDVVVPPAGLELALEVSREPRLTLVAENDALLAGDVWIQAGDDAALWKGEPQGVPPGREVVIVGLGHDGRVWRADLGRVDADREVDVDAAELLRPTRELAAFDSTPVTFSGLDEDGAPLPLASVSVLVGLDWIGTEPPEGETRTALALDLPVGFSYQAAIEAPGHLTTWAVGTAEIGAQAVVRPRRPARLAIEGTVARAIVGGDFHARVERPLELSPGRHDLVLLREDGTGVRCELDLAAGAERTIAWR